MAAIQCWEYMKCGQEIISFCPAFLQNQGRACWYVAGTMCGGKVQGIYARTIESCRECDFYKKVKAREI
jgi:hypothetical protein